MNPYAELEAALRAIFRRAQSSTQTLARHIHPDLDAAAFPLLARVMEQPGTRGSDLAAHFQVGRATISRQLSRLEELGFISRAVDPEDSRGQLISLTEYGRRMLNDARESRIQVFREALADWDEADVSAFAAMLNRYSESFLAWSASNDWSEPRR